MTLSTPLGMPAAVAASARITAVRGVLEAGFITIVFPMIRAGAIFHMARAVGKFQGTIPTHTPTGSLRTNSRPGAKALPEARISSSKGNFVAA
jgi:hypothetical protein